MSTAVVLYREELRTEAEHLASGMVLVTDAPTDNHGKGQSFSPTDLTATSLASCMLTVMGIHAERNDVPFKDVRAEVTKVMASKPRRIARIIVSIEMSGKGLDAEAKRRLERIALYCPVAKSLSEDIEQEVTFTYN